MKKENGKVARYLKRNAVYVILALCIIAVGLSVTLMLVNRGENQIVMDEQIVDDNNNLNSGDTNGDIDLENKDPEIDVPVVVEPTYVMPVSTASKITEYSEDLKYNSTLKRFESHKAVDFFAEEGTDVFAVSSGVIKSVENSFLEGYTITIDHGNGLETVYNSLSEDIDVVVGQRVSAGEVIGEVSVTNRKEDNEGAHLHFYMLENGVRINPEKYILFENK